MGIGLKKSGLLMGIALVGMISLGALNVDAATKTIAPGYFTNVKDKMYFKTTKKIKLGIYTNALGDSVGKSFYAPKNSIVQLAKTRDSHGKVYALFSLVGTLNYNVTKSSVNHILMPIGVPLKKSNFKLVNVKPSKFVYKQFLMGKPSTNDNVDQFMITLDNYIEFYKKGALAGMAKPLLSDKILKITETSKATYLYLKNNNKYLPAQKLNSGVYRLKVTQGANVKVSMGEGYYQSNATYTFGHKAVWNELASFSKR
ncbi:hypothetical protein EQG49_09055 [Periweissella cryptocerci]|uniref:Uncharacterized protein n=1 Tax=Periweissella cryptocerci TaxID=2506420 RepID=A0A4P6YV35_9LACO|nr:hypothetical protein [Periweissella cryptocerci]QBO36611.1 hypothetical protein EQG49_09055 [Periweissella cryptocerci]